MIIHESPELADDLIQYLRALLDGKVTLGPVDYKRDLTHFHRSELLGCLMIPYLERMEKTRPALSKERILYFSRGRAVERVFGADNEPLLRNGITISVDLKHPKHGLVEIKSTVMGSENFAEKLPTRSAHWVEECKAVAAAHDVTSCNLAVVFMVGNTPSHKWGKPGRVAVDLKAWKMDFTPEELAASWEDMLWKRDKVNEALDHEEYPELTTVKVTVPKWGCKECQWAERCPYFAELIMEQKEK
jgi:hypothetical protein